jgi:hypothetical protein
LLLILGLLLFLLPALLFSLTEEKLSFLPLLLLLTGVIELLLLLLSLRLFLLLNDQPVFFLHDESSLKWVNQCHKFLVLVGQF